VCKQVHTHTQREGGRMKSLGIVLVLLPLESMGTWVANVASERRAMTSARERWPNRRLLRTREKTRAAEPHGVR